MTKIHFPQEYMDDFLSLFKKNTKYTSTPNIEEREIFFCIDKDGKGAFVTTVDKQMKQVQVDYHSYNGSTFSILRSLDSIREKNLYKIDWEKQDERIYLGEYDYLLYLLIRCDNLCDSKGKKIEIAPSPEKIRLHLERGKDTFMASFFIRNQKLTEFTLLSDSFILADHVIYQINPIGENYNQLSFFQTTFQANRLETYLSLFFSYIENVDFDFEDLELVRLPDPISTIPVLIFEKVDADKALFVHVNSSLPNQEYQDIEKFDITWQAWVNEVERKVTLKRIIRSSLEADVSKLGKLIAQYAPDKESKKAIYQKDNFFIIPEETASPFLLHGLPSLLNDFVLLGAEKLREYKIKVVNPDLRLSLASGIDFLEGDATLLFDQEPISLQEVLSQFRKKKYVLLSDGNRAVINDSYIKRIERIFRQSKKTGKVSVSFFDLPELEELLQTQAEETLFVKHRQFFEGLNELKTKRLTLPPLNATLREYQYEGFKWLNYLYTYNQGGCLADDMGLGKTIQMIALLARIYPKVKQSSLIVMPRSLLFNWQNELKKFAPQLSVYTYYGATRDLSEASQYHLILTTYAIVRNDIQSFLGQKFHCVILDESQNIKNINAQITQAILLLKSEHRFALSGTPIENNLTELYSLFRFLNPAMFGSLDEFNIRYTLPIQKENNKEAMAGLRKKIYPFMLRRLKKDVLSELPDRIDQPLYVEMSDEQHALYEQRRAYYYQQIKQTIAEEGLQKSQFVMFQALNELRRIASVPESVTEGRIASPKLDCLLESLTDAVSNSHKVVIFFNFIAGIELVGEKLDELGIDFVSMTGSTRDRQSLVERFQNDPRCLVFLMTLKTGGVGLNLTAADTVYLFEPWWNKAAEEQAVNRLHRIGQVNKVLSYSLLTQNSIEEKICLLQQKKAELFAELIGNDGTAATKNLSEEDIDYILG